MISYLKEIAFDVIQHYLQTYDEPRHLDVVNGQLIIKDSDIAVWEILSELSRGYTVEDIADSFQISMETIMICLADISKLLQEPVKVELPVADNGIHGIVNLLKNTILKRLGPR
jgi:uncharacterized protein (DUF433 family)